MVDEWTDRDGEEEDMGALAGRPFCTSSSKAFTCALRTPERCCRRSYATTTSSNIGFLTVS